MKPKKRTRLLVGALIVVVAALGLAFVVALRRPVPEYTRDFAKEDAAARAIIAAARAPDDAAKANAAKAALEELEHDGKRAWLTLHLEHDEANGRVADRVALIEHGDVALALGFGGNAPAESAVLQVDVEIAPPWTGTWRGPFDLGLDVGIDGMIDERQTRLPLSFVEDGGLRALANAKGDIVRTYALVETASGPKRVVLGAMLPEEPVTSTRLIEASRLAGEYLVEHLNEDGRFDYEMDAATGKRTSGYNVLRHAGTTYALLQLYHVTQDRRFLDAADDANTWLFEKIELDPRDKAGKRRFVNDAKKVKLGGSALALLDVVERLKAPNPPPGTREIAEGLALHVLAQQRDDGRFDSYDAPTSEHVDDERDSIYYPGEAILALARWDAIAGDPEHRWRKAAHKGARYLIEERHRALGVRVRQPVDAWLVLGLELIDRDEPDEELVDYTLDMAARVRREMHGPDAPPPFRGARAEIGFGSLISTGSRMELLAAATALEQRHRPSSTLVRDAALANASHGLRYQYNRERLFMTTSRARALGGMPTSPVDPRVRIDGVQHNMSGWMALAAALDGRTLP